MRKNRRAPRFKACAIATVAAAAGTLVFTGSALAQTYNVTNEAGLDSAVASIDAGAATANTINLAGGSYNPGSTLSITKGPLTIQGPTPSPGVSGVEATLTGGSIVPVGASLFTVATGVTVNFNNLDLSGAGTIGGSPAIDDSGIANLNQTTISPTGPGLDIETGGTATLVNSTISDGQDFGIIDDGTATLTNSTVTRNSNGGIDSANAVALNLYNSIVAYNGYTTFSATASNKDCNAHATAQSDSLDGDGTCGVSLSQVNPHLGAIAAHGGTSQTDIPAVGSPAIAAGDPTKCPAVDERGAARPASPTACDVGAVQTFYSGAAPVFTTANISVATTAAATGKAVNYTPTWTDAQGPVSESPTNTCSVTSGPSGEATGPTASGSTFLDGTSTLSCAGTDTFGNTATGTFTIKVTADPAPSINTPTPAPTVPATSANGAVVTYTVSATDTFDGTDAVTCSQLSNTTFVIGATTVNCSATNSVGETTTKSFVVTVTDPAPVVTPSNNITAGGASGSAVTFNPTPSATDFKDGTDTVTCTAPLGSGGATVTVTSLPAAGATVFPVGTTTVTCTATNTSSVQGSATFTVTVNAVVPSSTTENVIGEVPHGTQSGALQITAQPCDFGPVFIPALAATYNCPTTATVTSTDANATLTINDTNTGHTGELVGHLYNTVGPTSLVTALTDKASSSVATGPTSYTPLSGSPVTLLTYSAPVTDDAVTLDFDQAITATEPLTFGTYGATVLLSLTTTTP